MGTTVRTAVSVSTVKDLIATGLQEYGPSYRCFLCDDRIAVNSPRYDGGPGRRAHKTCVDEFAAVFPPDTPLCAASSSRALTAEQKRLNEQVRVANRVRQLFCDLIEGKS